MKENKTIVEISSSTILKVVLVILGLIAAWMIKPVIMMVFLAFIFSSAFKPYVNFLEKYKIPRLVSTIVIILLFLLVVSIGLVTIVNEALVQLRALIEQLPNTAYSIISSLEKIFPVISQYVDPTVIKTTLLTGAQNLLNLGPSILSTGVSGAFEFLNNTFTTSFYAIMIMIMAIYMIVRKDNVYDGLLLLVEKKKRANVVDLLSKIEIKVGEWLRTELFIMLVMGFVVWFGLMIPGVFIKDYALSDYALPIAFLAMLLEMIPGTGVGVAGILSALIAIGFGQPYVALYAGIFAIVITQLETNLFIPSVMKKVVGVDPIVTIAGFVALYILFGVMGAILVVPIMIVLQLVVDYSVDGVVDTQ